MSLSYAITHASGNTTESVTLSVAEKTSMVLTGHDTDPKTGRVSATYVLSSGDPTHPATVRYSLDPVSVNGKSRYASVTFQTWATQTDSVSGLVTWFPIQVTMSFVIAGGAPVQLADLMQLAACGFSYTYASVAGGVRDTVWLQDILFGSPTVK